MPTGTLPGSYHLRYGDWLAFPDDGRLYEILGGELYMTPPPSVGHQRLARDLGFHLLAYLRASGRGELLQAPVGVKLGEVDVVEPDLVVVLAAHAGRIGPQVIEGPPDLVIEVLSPGTAARDSGPKRDLYARSGVPEYWIVDPEARSLEVLRLSPGESAYRRTAVLGKDDTLSSPLLPGFSLALGDVFASH